MWGSASQGNAMPFTRKTLQGAFYTAAGVMVREGEAREADQGHGENIKWCEYFFSNWSRGWPRISEKEESITQTVNVLVLLFE